MVADSAESFVNAIDTRGRSRETGACRLTLRTSLQAPGKPHSILLHDTAQCASAIGRRDGLVLFFFARSPVVKEKERPDGMKSVTLSQKDSTFATIPPSAGGASAEVLYSPQGPGLHFVLHASGFKAGRRYLLELQVDDVIYTVASYSPSARGARHRHDAVAVRGGRVRRQRLRSAASNGRPPLHKVLGQARRKSGHWYDAGRPANCARRAACLSWRWRRRLRVRAAR